MFAIRTPDSSFDESCSSTDGITVEIPVLPEKAAIWIDGPAIVLHHPPKRVSNHWVDVHPQHSADRWSYSEDTFCSYSSSGSSTALEVSEDTFCVTEEALSHSSFCLDDTISYASFAAGVSISSEKVTISSAASCSPLCLNESLDYDSFEANVPASSTMVVHDMFAVDEAPSAKIRVMDVIACAPIKERASRRRRVRRFIGGLLTGLRQKARNLFPC